MTNQNVEIPNLATMFASYKLETPASSSSKLDKFKAPPESDIKKSRVKKAPKKKSTSGRKKQIHPNSSPYAQWAKSKIQPQTEVFAVYTNNKTYIFTDEELAKVKADYLDREIEERRYDGLFFNLRPGQTLVTQGMVHSTLQVTPNSVVIQLKKEEKLYHHRTRAYSADSLIKIRTRLEHMRNQHVGQALNKRQTLRYLLDSLDIVYTPTDLTVLNNIFQDVFNINFDTGRKVETTPIVAHEIIESKMVKRQSKSGRLFCNVRRYGK